VVAPGRHSLRRQYHPVPGKLREITGQGLLLRRRGNKDARVWSLRCLGVDDQIILASDLDESLGSNGNLAVEQEKQIIEGDLDREIRGRFRRRNVILCLDPDTGSEQRQDETGHERQE
jgi:hypothetical protein